MGARSSNTDRNGHRSQSQNRLLDGHVANFFNSNLNAGAIGPNSKMLPGTDINASGGTTATYISGLYTYKSHTFTANGGNTFVVNSGSGDIEYLLVAGGGGTGSAPAGGNREGGSGAGGMLTGTTPVSPGSYPLSLGAGGTGGQSGSPTQGGNSTGFSATAYGGGGGGYDDPAPSAYGRNGGSGGGAWYILSPLGGGKGVYPGSPYVSAPRQGYDGSPGNGSPDYGGAGGGAGGAGGFGTNIGPGAVNDYRTGSNITYAAGGAANDFPSTDRTANGAVNTGNGGSGRGTGGPGIIVVRYKI